MSRGLADRLRAAGFRGRINVDEPLGPLTTWRMGGPADLLVLPIDLTDLAVAIEWARSCNVPRRVMGNGSNLLIRDDGVRGLVIRIRRVLDECTSDGDRWIAGAGISFPNLARKAALRGHSGLEFAGGIPGTFGGAIVMNAGWHEFEVGSLIRSVEVVRADGSRREYRGDACQFRYRGSRFRDGDEIVVSGVLDLPAAPSTEIVTRMDEFAESRKSNQPTELASCGSVFLKPSGDFAGRLIEQAGLKGLRVGGLEVSPKHANFFVNVGGGTAADALELVERVETEVLQKFGVRLEREFEIW